MSKLYVAGPMTGFPAYNVAAFEDAARFWSGLGFQVETPFDVNSRVWQKHYGRDFDPHNDMCDWGDPILAEMFVEDIAVLYASDVVVLLKGWQRSKGATTECLLAHQLGKRIMEHETGAEISVVPSLSFAVDGEPVTAEATRLVHGNRGADYGHPLEDFTRTARIWSAILGNDVTPQQVALCMIGVKISRECNKPKRDNRVDIAGYAETLHMVEQKLAGAA